VTDLTAALADAGLPRCPACTGWPNADNINTNKGLPTTTGCDRCRHTGRAHLTWITAEPTDHPDFGLLSIRFGPAGVAWLLTGPNRIDNDTITVLLADLSAAQVAPPGRIHGVIIDDRRPRVTRPERRQRSAA